MSVDQSFAVAMHTMSVIAFSEPDPVSAAFVASQINVHPVVIRRAMGKLVNGGIATSLPGSQGGYKLAKPAEQVSLWDVYSSIHKHNNFAANNAMPTANCEEGRQIASVLTDIYADADRALESELRKTTLADVLKQAAKVS